LIDLAKLQLPSPHGKNFHEIKIVTPPAPQDNNVDTTAEPIALPSPSSFIEAYDNIKFINHGNFLCKLIKDII
jgi:hypothetical protein